MLSIDPPLSPYILVEERTGFVPTGLQPKMDFGIGRFFIIMSGVDLAYSEVMMMIYMKSIVLTIKYKIKEKTVLYILELCYQSLFELRRVERERSFK